MLHHYVHCGDSGFELFQSYAGLQVHWMSEPTIHQTRGLFRWWQQASGRCEYGEGTSRPITVDDMTSDTADPLDERLVTTFSPAFSGLRSKICLAECYSAVSTAQQFHRSSPSKHAFELSGLDERIVIDFRSSAVPEPSTWAMMLLGFCGLGFFAYRRKDRLVSNAA